MLLLCVLRVCLYMCVYMCGVQLGMFKLCLIRWCESWVDVVVPMSFLCRRSRLAFP